jgi:hypothetical protein
MNWNTDGTDGTDCHGFLGWNSLGFGDKEGL